MYFTRLPNHKPIGLDDQLHFSKADPHPATEQYTQSQQKPILPRYRADTTIRTEVDPPPSTEQCSPLEQKSGLARRSPITTSQSRTPKPIKNKSPAKPTI